VNDVVGFRGHPNDRNLISFAQSFLKAESRRDALRSNPRLFLHRLPNLIEHAPVKAVDTNIDSTRDVALGLLNCR
jgi:hypothetical protein